MPPLSPPASRVVSPLHTAVRGRARLRIAGLRKHEALKAALEFDFDGSSGVRILSANSTTGNVLVAFDPSVDLEIVIGVVERAVASVPVAARNGARRAPAPQRNGSSGLLQLLRGLMQLVAQRQSSTSGAQHPSRKRSPDWRRVKAPAEHPWHLLPAREAAAILGTSATKGLALSAADQRLAEYGHNVLPVLEPPSGWRILLDQFKSLPVLLLGGSAVISVLTGGFADAVVITVVVLLNAWIGFAVETHSRRTIRALTEIEEPRAIVLREGRILEIDGAQCVPGDLIVLTRGTFVVADARLLEAEDLTTDESILTGESLPAEKTFEPLANDSASLSDRRNLVFRGTVVTGGSGLAVVIATGRRTEIGRIQMALSESNQPDTPLQRQLEKLGKQLLWATAGLTGAVFVIGILRGYSVLSMARTAISLAIAAVPEGLPTVATVSLAHGMSCLLHMNIVVRRLAAVEALGTVEVVCFDKTGTLTSNNMSVVAIYAGRKEHGFQSGKLYVEGKRPEKPADEVLKLLEICCLCSEAEIAGIRGEQVVSGSPTEAALVRAALETGVRAQSLREGHPVIRTFARSNGRNYVATHHRTPSDEMLVAVKGSPAEVLPLCDSVWVNGAIRRLRKAERRAILAENDAMGAAGMRVLGVAFRAARDGDAEVQDLVWLGLVGMADPPREGLRELIRAFRKAGVRPVMITGDQTATARALGRSIGIEGNDPLQVIDAAALEREGDNPEGFRGAITGAHIFSRVNPSHKLRIVQEMQNSGRIVAMTGDGVNDGPALNAAHVGIALGQNGTRSSREVADLLLLDDNVHALLPAICEGRRVHENIRKSVRYISATNLSEILVTLVSIAAGLGTPFNPRQLLWINVISDVFPELALAIDPAEGDLLARRPCDANGAILNGSDYSRAAVDSAVMAASALASYAFGRLRYGSKPVASSLAFLTLASAQLLHGSSARSDQHSVRSGNRMLSGAIGTGFGLTFLGTLLPAWRGVMGLAKVGISGALVSAAAAGGSFLVIETLKRSRAAAAGPLPAAQA